MKFLIQDQPGQGGWLGLVSPLGDPRPPSHQHSPIPQNLSGQWSLQTSVAIPNLLVTLFTSGCFPPVSPCNIGYKCPCFLGRVVGVIHSPLTRDL